MFDWLLQVIFLALKLCSNTFLADKTPISTLPPDSSSAAIEQDLVKCSLSLGVSHEALRSDFTTLNEISNKASFFLSNIWAIAPRHKMIPEFKSSCWYIDETTLHELRCMLPDEGPGLDELAFACLPYFFIAGFPKCGTSAFHGALQEHRQVAKPRWKEPQWWTRGPLGRTNHSWSYYETAVITYFSNYIQASAMIANGYTDTITYDGSQSTMYDSNFFINYQDYCALPVVMSRVLPNAKFTVLLRNPVSRLYSHYIFGCTARVGVKVSTWPAEMRENPAAHFHNEVVSDIEYVNQCIQDNSLYECVTANTFRGDVCGRVGLRLTIGIYYIHLLKWYHFYPRKNFLFLRTEDLQNNPTEAMAKATYFLGIDTMPDEMVEEAFSQRYKYLSPVTDDPSIELVMRNETKQILEEFYAPYNQLLSDLLEDERFLWKDQ